MQTAQIKTPNGKIVAEINIPGSLSEVALNRYIDFVSEMAKANSDNIVLCTAKAVSNFYAIDLMDTLQAQFDFEQDNDAKQSAIETVAQLYGHAANLISTELDTMYTSPAINIEDNFFIFAGEKYYIPTIVPRALAAGDEQLPGLSTIEVIEAAETKRACEQLTDENGDLDGSLAFTKYLQLLAVLTRKEGEVLQIDEVERREFIAERTAHFGGASGEMIDAKTALAVDFFLTAFFMPYAKGHIAPTFLYLQSLAISVSIRPNKPLPMQGRKARRMTTQKKYLNGSVGAHLLPRYPKKNISKPGKPQK